MQLIVNVKKLNKRSSVPATLSEKNIIGTVFQGFQFEGEEITSVPNPTLGKWYKDRDGSYYWGGGLLIVPDKVSNKINSLPANLPPNYQAGIDISHHNGHINWADIKNSEAHFVYIKLSEGVGTPDNKALEHANNAKQLGLKIGYYHFCRPDQRNGGTVINDATAEANEAIKLIAGLPKADLPLVLDLEDQPPGWDTPLNKEDYLSWVSTFISTIAEKSGLTCMIYSRKEYLDRKLPVNHHLGQNKLWVSYYPSKPDANRVSCPIGWTDWAMWQFTESGSIGSNPNLDINILKDATLFKS
jgi:lysozyme